MAKQPTCTLLISTYNWPQALNLVLLSVLNQKQLPTEIVIADDGSKEETKKLIDSYRDKFSIPIKHVWHKDEGFRKTIILNKAVNESIGEYIVQIDGDIVLHPMFIADHLSNAQSAYFVKGSRAMLNKEKTERQLKNQNININSFQKGVKSSINGTRLAFLSPLFYGNPTATRNTKGCNFAFWKKDFIAINGYNNDLLGWGHEDIEIAARLVNLGIKRRHLKMTAVCFHLFHNNSNETKAKETENINLKVYEETVKYGIKTCKNGFQQTIANCNERE